MKHLISLSQQLFNLKYRNKPMKSWKAKIYNRWLPSWEFFFPFHHFRRRNDLKMISSPNQTHPKANNRQSLIPLDWIIAWELLECRRLLSFFFPFVSSNLTFSFNMKSENWWKENGKVNKRKSLWALLSNIKDSARDLSLISVCDGLIEYPFRLRTRHFAREPPPNRMIYLIPYRT